MRRVALVALLLGALLGGWAWVASLHSVDDLLVASPGETARALASDWDLLWSNAWVTLREVLIGLAIAVSGGAGATVAGPLGSDPR
ncbi:MAG: hypothetical protein ACR2LH_01625 [Thermoleophilaceae bacterium]